jgi:enoyl-CoA hydratase/carnithine racemase
MPADAGVIDVESRHGVGWIVMSRPPLNVVTAGMAREMRAAVEQLDADTSSSVIVITAHGDRAFAAGADVEEHRLELIRELNDELFALADTLRKADGKPRIAVVKGICSGGANEIAFACDIVVARSDTRFALPEINIGAVNNFGALLMSSGPSCASHEGIESCLESRWSIGVGPRAVNGDATFDISSLPLPPDLWAVLRLTALRA